MAKITVNNTQKLDLQVSVLNQKRSHQSFKSAQIILTVFSEKSLIANAIRCNIEIYAMLALLL